MVRRETKQRELILDILKKTNAHPTADTIYEAARKELPNISKGTVYRNLIILQENGLINELSIEGTVSRYEYKQEPHYHFKCEQCGRVIDVDFPIDLALNEKVSRETGLLISYHQLEFCGLCQDCQRVNNAGSLQK